MSRQPNAPKGRGYRQYCGVARALDVVGERWTLLIVRDLLLGPRRYKDLLEGLPGIGTNLLADRLRELEQRGLIRRAVLPPPAGSTVYELTEFGAALGPAVHELGSWGARMLGVVNDDDRVPTAALFVALRVIFKPERATGVQESYELHVDGHVFEVRVDEGQILTREGLAHAPAATFTVDSRTLLALVREGLDPRAALAAGRIQVEGKIDILERFVSLFARPPEAAGEPAYSEPRNGAAEGMATR
ncbi:MAG: transcriptional regulator [Chloroflexi bacterium]|nr:transcriptional regulator [Chloroflexota bacterium]